MLEQKIEALTKAVLDLTDAMQSAQVKSKKDTPKKTSKAASLQVEDKPVKQAPEETPIELTHDDVTPLVMALSKKNRTQAKKIVSKYGERLSAIGVKDLAALKNDLETALAE